MEIIESPCISVCEMNPAHQFCRGCWRTIEEIEDWEAYDEEKRLEIIRQLHSRRIAAGGRGRRQTSRRNKRET